MSKYSSSGGVPSRWLDCPRMASDLISNIIAFKTPLSQDYDEFVPQHCRFSPKMLFEKLKRKKVKSRYVFHSYLSFFLQINLGLWIDLTNTSRFYNKQEVESENCKYVKLQCRGHGEAPSVEQKDRFVNLVHNFITQHPLQFIGVHCTHGFNRTGFLIVSYLVEKADCALDVALDKFAKVRPPGIYKADYLQELYQRYDEVEDTPLPPQLPDWCHENGVSSNLDNYDDGPVPEEPSSSRNSNHGRNIIRAKRKKWTNKNPVFMAGVPGVSVFTEEPKASELQRKVQDMCEWKR